jgi:microcystin-dependent protein
MKTSNGSSPAGRLTAAFFGSNPALLGAVGGSQSNTLATTMIPAHFHGASIAETAHAHGGQWRNIPRNTSGGYVSASNDQNTYIQDANGTTATALTNVKVQSAVNGVNSTDSTGGGQPHANVQPTKLCTFYMRL